MDKSARWSAKHEEIVQRAIVVFLREGFHAAAMDQLIEGTGISKRTLYKHFANKEELVLACLTSYRESLLAGLSANLGLSGDPRQRILRLFDLKYAEYLDGNYCGCLAMNAKLEYEGKEGEIEEATRVFYQLLLDYLEENCRQAGYLAHNSPARQILVLFQGSIAATKIFHDAGFTLGARAAAAALLGLFE